MKTLSEVVRPRNTSVAHRKVCSVQKKQRSYLSSQSEIVSFRSSARRRHLTQACLEFFKEAGMGSL